MNLKELRWTKNVNATHGEWVYAHDEVSYPYLVPELCLHWKTTAKENAKKPNPDDLILLRQRTRVTHIVKILDDIVHEDNEDSSFTDFALWRRVQVMWMAPKPWHEAPHQNNVFGFDVDLQGGKVIALDNIIALQEHFKDAGGIAAFQERVKQVLGIKV